MRVRLLEKPDCGLCDDALHALRRLSQELPLDIERDDITKSSALFDRYAVRIPVLLVGEQELDIAGLEDAAIRRWLVETAKLG